MTTTIIISMCVLLLFAYVFDMTASKTKVPSVILLLLLGWGVRQLTHWIGYDLPDFSPILDILGTIGLIMIVLEGSLELEFNRSKFGLIKKSIFGASISMVALAFVLAFAFQYFGNYSLKDSLVNAIPLCVISSAIAIPSVRDLSPQNKEFVIYESSLSDIIGVLLFNFLALNRYIDAASFGEFGIQLVVISVISFLATIMLSLMLSKIKHHIKFIPIILLVVLIYSVSKIYHLPALIFILIFGLFIGNLDELKGYRWVERFKPEILNREVRRFKALIAEGAFLVRALFFLVFGFLIEAKDVLNADTSLWAIGIVSCIVVFRIIQLKLSNLPIWPLLFVAPRGLITILLFISINPADAIPLVNRALIIQVIVLTALFMMVGLMIHRKPEQDEESEKLMEATATSHD